MQKVIAGQFGLGFIMAALLWSIFGTVAGYSALLGGLIATVPNAFLALRLSVPRRNNGAKSLVRAAYIGELGKLALTVLAFSIVFALVRPLAAAPLFATFVLTAMVPLAGFLLVNEQYQGKDRLTQHGE